MFLTFTEIFCALEFNNVVLSASSEIISPVSLFILELTVVNVKLSIIYEVSTNILSDSYNLPDWSPKALLSLIYLQRLPVNHFHLLLLMWNYD